MSDYLDDYGTFIVLVLVAAWGIRISILMAEAALRIIS